jgi:hypothetical protein
MTVRSHAARRQVWIERLARFAQAGQSVAQFCAEEDILAPLVRITEDTVSLGVAALSRSSSIPRRATTGRSVKQGD